MTKTLKGFVLALVVGLAACGGDDDDKNGSEVRASCNDIASSGVCEEVAGAFSTADMAELEASCDAVFSTSPCPSAGREATCTIDASDFGYPAGTEIREHYYDFATAEDEEFAQGLCIMIGGTWRT